MRLCVVLSALMQPKRVASALSLICVLLICSAAPDSRDDRRAHPLILRNLYFSPLLSYFTAGRSQYMHRCIIYTYAAETDDEFTRKAERSLLLSLSTGGGGFRIAFCSQPLMEAVGLAVAEVCNALDARDEQ
jgi:hypothetical protein